MSGYAVRLVPDECGLRVVCRDLPAVLTWGDDQKEALTNAADAIEVVVAANMARGMEIPDASAAEPGEIMVHLPAPLALKAGVYRAWREARISKSELARRMKVAENEARRILDPDHATKLATMIAAAEALGCSVDVTVARAA